MFTNLAILGAPPCGISENVEKWRGIQVSHCLNPACWCLLIIPYVPWYLMEYNHITWLNPHCWLPGGAVEEKKWYNEPWDFNHHQSGYGTPHGWLISLACIPVFLHVTDGCPKFCSYLRNGKLGFKPPSPSRVLEQKCDLTCTKSCRVDPKIDPSTVINWYSFTKSLLLAYTFKSFKSPLFLESWEAVYKMVLVNETG